MGNGVGRLVDLNASQPRNAFVRNSATSRRQPSIYQETTQVTGTEQNVINRVISVRPHLKKHSDKDGAKIRADDLMWEGKRKLYPSLVDLKNLDERAVNAPDGLDNNITDLLAYLCQGVENQTAMKVRIIAIWIASHIIYDDSLDSSDSNVNDVSTVLRTKRALCGGFSRLYEYLCNLSNAECKYISGLARSSAYDPAVPFNVHPTTGELTRVDRNEHAWNIILIEGQWYMVDLTWAAGTLSSSPDGTGVKSFHFKWHEEWFLCEPYGFLSTHYPFKNRRPHPSRQNLLKPISTVAEWSKSPLYTVVFYDYGLKPLIDPQQSDQLWKLADDENCILIQFSCPVDLNFICKLSTGKSEKEAVRVYQDYCMVSVKDGVVRVHIRLPSDSRVYKFELWASLVFVQEDRLKEYKLLCMYALSACTNYHNIKNQPFPSGAWPYWGPTYNMDAFRIEASTHRGPVVPLDGDGTAKLSFRFACDPVPQNIPVLTFALHKADEPETLKERFLAWRQGDMVYLKVAVQKKGAYRLTVSARPTGQSRWHRLANYLIDAEIDYPDFSPRFPDWPYVLGVTEQFHAMHLVASDTCSYVVVKEASCQYVWSFDFLVPLQVDYQLTPLTTTDSAVSQASLDRYIYASVDHESKRTSFTFRFGDAGWYLFSLYLTDTDATTPAHLAMFVFVCKNAYKGILFPKFHGFWGVTDHGRRRGVSILTNGAKRVHPIVWSRAEKAIFRLRCPTKNFSGYTAEVLDCENKVLPVKSPVVCFWEKEMLKVAFRANVLRNGFYVLHVHEKGTGLENMKELCIANFLVLMRD